MCDNAIYYKCCNLWTYWDSGVSNCNMSLDLFTYQTQDATALSHPRFKFGIYGKETTNVSVSLTNSELYKLIYYCKQKILSPLNSLCDKIKSDKKFTEGFNIPGRNKNIYVTFLHQPLLNSPCIRFMIGEKEQSLVDTDKIYIPLIEFNSLYLSMNNAFNNYPLMSQNIMLMDMVKKYTEQFDERIYDIDRTIREFKENTVQKIVETDVSNVSFDESENEDKTIPTTEIKQEIESVKNEEHDEFDNFLKENRDDFKLDLPEEKNFQPPQEMDLDNTFQKKILINGFSDLEKIIISCINSKLPLDSFKNTIYQLSGEDLYDGISIKDQYAINYVVTDNIKINFKKYLEKQVDLPKLLNPIIIEDKSDSRFKIDLMKFLILSYIYLSKINNDLDGVKDGNLSKSIFCFSLKTITSPFIFSYLIKQNKDVFINCVCDLYKKLLEDKYFEAYEDNIYNSLHKHVGMTLEHLRNQLVKLYDNVQKYKDKLSITSFFKKYMKLSYNDFDLIDNFDSSKIEVILDLEYSKPVKTTYDLNIELLKKLGLKQQKLPSSNMINYIRNKYPKFNDLEQIKTINVSINEILNKVDLNIYPADILKALYFWETCSKNISFDDYSKMIENSSLDEKQLISMLLKSSEFKEDENFYNSLQIINDER